MIFINAQELAIDTLKYLEKYLAKFPNPDKVGADREQESMRKDGYPAQMIERAGEFEVTVSPYKNGREKGYTFNARYWMHSEDPYAHRVTGKLESYGPLFRATWSEGRSCDSVVIYFEEYADQGDRYSEILRGNCGCYSDTYLPTAESYDNRIYELHPGKAARIIEKRFREWAKNCKVIYEESQLSKEKV